MAALKSNPQINACKQKELDTAKINYHLKNTPFRCDAILPNSEWSSYMYVDFVHRYSLQSEPIDFGTVTLEGLDYRV